MENNPTTYDLNDGQEDKVYTHPIEKEVFDLLMVGITHVAECIKNSENFHPELRPIAAKHYRIYAVRLLRQYIDKRDFENDFVDVLAAFEPYFKEVVIELNKKRIARLHRKIADNPTDELYSKVCYEQYMAENEFIINPDLYLLPMYHERLTSLMVSLKERRAVLGSFDKQISTGKRKVEKPFSEYFVPKNQNELAEICKSIFNKNDRPKDYAIMTCLLSEKGFIVVSNKGRKDFFCAWYKYINRPLPKRCNFQAINGHIADKAANGFVFKNEDDMDYLSLKNAFEKALINSKI